MMGATTMNLIFDTIHNLGPFQIKCLDTGSVSITRCKGRKHPNLAKPVRKRTFIFLTLLIERNSLSKTLHFEIFKGAKKVNSVGEKFRCTKKN